MLPYNSHLLKQTDKRKRLWRLGSQAAWAPVNSVLQHPPKQLTDASALFITVAILTAAPPVHGVVDGAYASSRQTEVVQTQASHHIASFRSIKLETFHIACAHLTRHVRFRRRLSVALTRLPNSAPACSATFLTSETLLRRSLFMGQHL